MAAWRSIVLSQQLQVQPARIDMLLLRARTALALAARGPRDRARLVSEGERIALKVAREVRKDVTPAAELLLAAVRAINGRPDAAVAHLDAAIAGYEGLGMTLQADCARARKGTLVGGEEGRSLLAHALSRAGEHGVAHLTSWKRAFAPGFAE
jgi:hypothetical protein